jgi:hypothetical protein
MEIIDPVQEKDVVDYDFAFSNGMRICQTLDTSLGDRAEEFDDRYLLFLAEKPSITDPDDLMPAETVTVFKDQVVLLINRTRKQRLPTEEERFEMYKTLHQLAKTVQ